MGRVWIGFNDPLLAQGAPANSKNPGVQAPHVNVDQNGVILKGYDPVAYFKQNRPIKVTRNTRVPTEEPLTISRLRVTKPPSTNLRRNMPPQYGGYCANGMTKGQLNDCDPNVFFIYKGKLYLCETPKKGKTFYSKPGANIRKADANWRTYEPPANPGFRRQLGS